MMSRADMRERLRIQAADAEAVNEFLASPDNPFVESLFDVLDKYGGVEQINRAADDAGRLETRLERLRDEGSPYLAGVEWLAEQRDAGAFVTLAEYRRGVLSAAPEVVAAKAAETGEVAAADAATAAGGETPDDAHAVTLEISALQFFPWLLAEARQAIEHRELMPGRFIRERNMAEQSQSGGDLRAVCAAMQVIGASHVESLDTRGIDGANLMVGLETITGYFGGIGEPNEHVLRWVDEYLHYFTEYGVREVLNFNIGTILAAFVLRKLGVRNQFKISVFMGVDNPWSVLWLLIGARLLGGAEGATSLSGINFSNSADSDTLRAASAAREALGLREAVRFEHHVTEAYKSIVRQPYERRTEVVEIAAEVPNISAEHEGGDPAVEASRKHRSDILDYFISQNVIEAAGAMEALERNYLDKHAALNHTAADLIRAGIGVKPASLLH
jgi:hypothetical protein